LGIIIIYIYPVIIAHLNINQVLPIRYLEHLAFIWV